MMVAWALLVSCSGVVGNRCGLQAGDCLEGGVSLRRRAPPQWALSGSEE